MPGRQPPADRSGWATSAGTGWYSLLRISLVKRNLGDGGRLYLALIVSLFSYPDSGEKRADTDSGRAQIIYLVDFQRCIESYPIHSGWKPPGRLLRHPGRIRRNSVGSDPDYRRLHIVRGSVQAGMVHPLVHDVERPLHWIQVGDGIFCKHCDVIRELINSESIGLPPGQYDKGVRPGRCPGCRSHSDTGWFPRPFAHILAAGCQFFHAACTADLISPSEIENLEDNSSTSR